MAQRSNRQANRQTVKIRTFVIYIETTASLLRSVGALEPESALTVIISVSLVVLKF